MAASSDAIELKALVEELVPAPEGFYTCNRTSVLNMVTERSAYKGLLGLEYIVEIHDGTTSLRYICRLCDTKKDANEILQHIVTPKHRKKYLEEHFPMVWYHTMPFVQCSIKMIVDDIVDEVSKRFDRDYGRFRPYSLSEAHAGELERHIDSVDEIMYQSESDYKYFDWYGFVKQLPFVSTYNLRLVFPGSAIIPDNS